MGISGNLSSCINGVKPTLKLQEGTLDCARDTGGEMATSHIDGGILWFFLRVVGSSRFLSCCDGDLRESLMLLDWSEASF